MAQGQQIKNFDQFYTQGDVANECLEDLLSFLKENNSPYKLDELTFLEPSAGDGAFLRALEKKSFGKILACDIDPKREDILKRDFIYDDLASELQNAGEMIVIGNPPFGKRASLAADFVNRAADYADTVAFILPLQFRKYSAQNKLKPALRLVFDKTLRPDSFVFNNKPYDVRCCFQIWTKKSFGEDMRLRQAPITTHKDFEMWQYNNTREAEKYFDKKTYQWDFAIPRQGYKDYTVKETDPAKMDRHTQWIFFKAHTPEVLERLKQLDYEKLSLKNITTPGFGKADVIEEYNKKFQAMDLLAKQNEDKTKTTLFEQQPALLDA